MVRMDISPDAENAFEASRAAAVQ